ncbi:MAG TPA: hypothetical protein VN696_07755 [Pyrinomonadaceae bacterium]|nr:hypothetical protein [Pyrinomonadaceae bacterium]
MKKVYLLAYSMTLGTQEEVIACLNTIPGLLWRSDMTNSFYLISEKSAEELVAAIRKCREGKGRFLITEIHPQNKQGWLTPDTWYLINNKTHKPREK